MGCSKVGLLIAFGIYTLPYGGSSIVKDAMDMLIGGWAGSPRWSADLTPGDKDVIQGGLNFTSSLAKWGSDVLANGSDSGIRVGTFGVDTFVRYIDDIVLTGYEVALQGLDFLDRVDGHYGLYKAMIKGMVNTTEARKTITKATAAFTTALHGYAQQTHTFLHLGHQLVTKLANVFNDVFQIAVGSVKMLLYGDSHDVEFYEEDLMRQLGSEFGQIGDATGTGSYLTNWFGGSRAGDDEPKVFNAGIRAKYGPTFFGYYGEEEIKKMLTTTLSVLIEATEIYRPILKGATNSIITVLKLLRSVIEGFSTAAKEGLTVTGTVIQTSTQPIVYEAGRAAGLVQRSFHTIGEGVGSAVYRVGNGFNTVAGGITKGLATAGQTVVGGIGRGLSSVKSAVLGGTPETSTTLTSTAELVKVHLNEESEIESGARSLNEKQSDSQPESDIIGHLLNMVIPVSPKETHSPDDVDVATNVMNSTTNDHQGVSDNEDSRTAENDAKEGSTAGDHIDSATKTSTLAINSTIIMPEALASEPPTVTSSTDLPATERSMVSNVGTSIVHGVEAVGGNVVEGVETASSAVASGLSVVASGIGKGAELVSSTVAEGAGMVGHAIGTVGQTIVEDIATPVASSIGSGAEIVGSTVAEGAGMVGHGIGTVGQTIVKDVGTPIASGITRGAGIIGSAVTNGASAAGNAIKKVGQTVVKGVSKTGQAISSGLSTAGTTIVTGLETVRHGIGSGLSSVGSALGVVGNGLSNVVQINLRA